MNPILTEILKSEQFDNISIAFILATLFSIQYLYKKHKDKKNEKSKNLQKIIDYHEKPKEKQRKIYKELLLEECFGKPISSEEIDYIEKRENSAIVLNTYLLSKEYFKFDHKNKEIKIKTKRIKTIKKVWLFFYFLSGASSIYIAETAFINKNYSFPTLMFLLASILIAILSLRQNLIASTAETLTKELNQDA